MCIQTYCCVSTPFSWPQNIWVTFVADLRSNLRNPGESGGGGSDEPD
jgi:hypothetical protein